METLLALSVSLNLLLGYHYLKLRIFFFRLNQASKRFHEYLRNRTKE